MDTHGSYDNGAFVTTFPIYVVNTGGSMTPICINGMVCLFTEELHAERLAFALDLDEYEIMAVIEDQDMLDELLLELFNRRAIGVLFDPLIRCDGKFMGFQKSLC